MRFQVEGVSYEFDETTLLVREARELMHHTGMGLRAFGAGLQEGNADSIVGMLYLCKRRAGEAVKWSDFDEMNLANIDIKAEPDAVEPAAPDPATNGATNGVALTNGQAVHTSPPVDVVDGREVPTTPG